MIELNDLLGRVPIGTARIVLSEGADSRVAEAAVMATRKGMAQIICVGDTADVRAALHAAGDDGSVTVADPATWPALSTYIDTYHARRAAKGMTREAAAVAMVDPIFFAAAMVAAGDADGTVGGAITPSPDIIRTALRVIGTAPDSPLLSSFFLMIFDNRPDLHTDLMVFTDCGMIIDPDAQELAQIAISAAGSMSSLTGRTPSIAMLSFSTKGSARHPAVTKVAEATRIAQDMRPDLAIDGEFQFDAAIVPSVGVRKAPGSTVAGAANILVFPNLDAGNIGYKIAQRLGGARAIGPVLQGLAKPANDLSRGCSAQDIVDMIAVTLAQAAQTRA